MRRHFCLLSLMIAASSGASFQMQRMDLTHSTITKATRIRSHITPLRTTQPPEDIDMHSPSFNKKLIVPLAALASISATTIAAFTGLLPGPLIDATAPPFFANLPFGVLFAGSYAAYSPALIYRDVAALVFSIVAASLFVKACTYPVTVGKLEPRDSRKIIHTFSAPLFLLVWPLFSNAYGARVFASIIPLVNAIRLYLAGTSSSDENNVSDRNTADGSENELAQAISRSGNAEEALGGPFVYVMVLLFFTLFCFTDSPVGVIAITTMAAGDGLADLIGRRFGFNNKWSFNKDKSVAGSTAFVSGAVVASYGLISWLIGFGVMDPLNLSTMDLFGRLLFISVVCAAVELIPAGDDNYSVPLSAAVLSSFLLT